MEWIETVAIILIGACLVSYALCQAVTIRKLKVKSDCEISRLTGLLNKRNLLDLAYRNEHRVEAKPKLRPSTPDDFAPLGNRKVKPNA